MLNDACLSYANCCCLQMMVVHIYQHPGAFISMLVNSGSMPISKCNLFLVNPANSDKMSDWSCCLFTGPLHIPEVDATAGASAGCDGLLPTLCYCHCLCQA